MATGRDRDVNCERRGWEQGEIGMGLPPGRDGDGNWERWGWELGSRGWELREMGMV